jgi:hypothetical protein
VWTLCIRLATERHDINYTYVEAAFDKRPQADKNRALFEADKEMLLNVMRFEPAPRDFITAAALFKWLTQKQYMVVCDACHRGASVDAKEVEPKLAKNPIPSAQHPLRALQCLDLALLVDAKHQRVIGRIQVPARKRLGNAKFKVVEAAPGRYVKARATQ